MTPRSPVRNHPPRKALSVAVGIPEIALHDDIAAHHHLAQGLAIGRHRQARLGIGDHQPFLHLIAHALAGLEIGLGLDGQAVPFLMPGADHRRAIDLGQAIDMGDLEARASCMAASTAAGGGAAAVIIRSCGPAGVAGGKRVEDHLHHDGRAAEMGHAMGRDGGQMLAPSTRRGRHGSQPPASPSRESTSHCNGTWAASRDRPDAGRNPRRGYCRGRSDRRHGDDRARPWDCPWCRRCN